MGACFSRVEPVYPSLTTAKVVSVDGELHEYPVPVTVYCVLRSQVAMGFSICDSDSLYYEKRIPAMSPREELVGNQIYFVLPESKLESGLTMPEMVALAIKASIALRKAGEKGTSNRRRMRKGILRVFAHDGRQRR